MRVGRGDRMPHRRSLIGLIAAAAVMLGVALAVFYLPAEEMRPATGAGPVVAPPDQPGEVAGPAPAEKEPEPEPESQPEPEPEPPRVLWEGPVEHIFFHPLVAFTELAFDGDAMEQGYDDWMTTVPEFMRIVEQLYRNNYILVDLNQLFEERDGALVRRELWLPEGKRPLILSVDDLNYYAYMRENGNVHKLILDEQGRIATLTIRPDGERLVAYDNEIVPILDRFVAEHPDFSLDGAKGMLALTGYEGILGYQTHEPGAPAYEQEKWEALRVVARLKETGWTFASHGWGHLDARQIRLETLVRDTQRWLDEVGSLVGPTLVYVYPHGSSVLPGDPKFEALQDAGFKVLCSVGPKPYLVATDAYAMMDRRHIDGMALREQQELLSPLFDADQVIDPVRPKRL